MYITCVKYTKLHSDLTLLIYILMKKKREKKEEMMHAGIGRESTVDYDRILGHICNLF